MRSLFAKRFQPKMAILSLAASQALPPHVAFPAAPIAVRGVF
jgi:hypothetical protein